MSTKPKAKRAEPVSRKNVVQIEEAPGMTRDQMLAKIAAGGLLSNTRTMAEFSKGMFGELSLTDCLDALNDSTKAVHGGDMKGAETMLNCQAVALNSIFNELARRAALNMGEYMGAMETYLRLAFKAQSQCTRTLETLAAIKNPPLVFAKQANINNGGQQQVNNGNALTEMRARDACTRDSSTAPNELLEASNGQRLDTAATGATSAVNQDLEAMGAFNRPKD